MRRRFRAVATSRIGKTKPYAPTTFAGVAASMTMMPRISAAEMPRSQ
jgi:hypothetical protein